MRFIFFATILLTTGLALQSCGGGDDDDAANGNLPAALKSAGAKRFMSSVLADFDGDSDLDIMLGALDRDSNPQDRLLLNDGTGTFSFAAETALPARAGGADYGTVQLQAADVDNDGDQDVLAAVHGPLPVSFSANVMLYLNNGDGTFTDGSSKVAFNDTTAANAEATIGNLVAADLNGDTNIDFLSVNGGFANQAYLNDGAGNFTQATLTGASGDGRFDNPLHMSAGDADNDGDVDIIALPNVFLKNGASYSVATEGGSYEIMFSAMLQDAAGGKPLLVGVEFQFLSLGETINVFQLNAGNSLINVTSSVLPNSPITLHPRNFQVRDFDGNGTDDLLFADHGIDSNPFAGAQNILLLQNTDGTLTNAAATNLPSISDFSHDVTAGDLDGDGDIDAYVSNLQNDGAEQSPYILQNNGSGVFSKVE